MKILHTADWHLGKKLNGVSRLEEQRAVLQEISSIADEKCVDVIIVAGDVFDTSVPTAEAEELFYEECVNLSRNRIFVALSGNHDDPQRLCAPSGIAKVLNVLLVGGYDNTVYTRKNITGGNGILKIERGGEKLNLAIMPYPQHSKLSNEENLQKPYPLIVEEKLREICDFNGNEFNVLASHLFLTKGESDENVETYDERELGTASILPSQILPQCDYTALGHIHKPQTVSKTRNIHYSGSILSYSFDDVFEKSVIVAQLSFDGGKKRTDVERIPLKSGKKLIRFKAQTPEAALEFLKKNENAYVELEYCGNRMLTQSEVSELKKQSSFNRLINNFKTELAQVVFKERTDKELFGDYYKKKFGAEAQPKDELTEMFLKVMAGEDVL